MLSSQARSPSPGPDWTVLPQESLSLDDVGRSLRGLSFPKCPLVPCPRHWSTVTRKKTLPLQQTKVFQDAGSPLPCSAFPILRPWEQFSSEFIIRGALCHHREKSLLRADSNGSDFLFHPGGLEAISQHLLPLHAACTISVFCGPGPSVPRVGLTLMPLTRVASRILSRKKQAIVNDEIASQRP